MWIDIKLDNNKIGIGCCNDKDGNDDNLQTITNNNGKVWITSSFSHQNKDGGDDDNHHGGSPKEQSCVGG